MKEKPSLFEWVAFGVFIILEIVIFGMRIIRPATEMNQAENVLYSTFEIVFSLYIGYFIQRIDSIRQFQVSLKNYGLSAYRRIMDIRKSVDRTLSQIERISVEYPKDKTSDIQALRLILEGTFDTVESSVLDWGDIIGEEIEKKEQANLLQEKLAKSEEKVNLSAEDKKNIEELRSELNKVVSELPLALRNESLTKEIENQNTIFYGNYFEFSVRQDKCLTLYIKLDIDPSEESIRKIMDSQPFFFLISFDAEKVQCLVFDKDKSVIGQVINPIAPYDNKYYLTVLRQVFWYLSYFDQDDTKPFYKLSNFRYARLTENKSTMILQLPIEGDFTPFG